MGLIPKRIMATKANGTTYETTVHVRAEDADAVAFKVPNKGTPVSAVPRDERPKWRQKLEDKLESGSLKKGDRVTLEFSIPKRPAGAGKQKYHLQGLSEALGGATIDAQDGNNHFRVSVEIGEDGQKLNLEDQVEAVEEAIGGDRPTLKSGQVTLRLR